MANTGPPLSSSAMNGAHSTGSLVRPLPSRIRAQKSLKSLSLSSQLNVRSHGPSEQFAAPTNAVVVCRFGLGSERGRLRVAVGVEETRRSSWESVAKDADADRLGVRRAALAGLV